MASAFTFCTHQTGSEREHAFVVQAFDVVASSVVFVDRKNV
jgi:hypothetical protein